MKTTEDATELATAMVSIGNNVGRNTMAIISSMEEPLGRAIGNALEVKEAIETLKGEGPEDLTELSLELGSQMVVLGGKADTLEEARTKLQGVIDDGSALEKFKVFLKNQGGDASMVEDPGKLPQAKYTFEVEAGQSGFVEKIGSEAMGVASSMLGAGRQTKDDVIDLAVGLMLNKKVGDRVETGESLVTIYSNTEDVEGVKQKILENYHIGANESDIELIRKVITE